ncbi:MAG: hypothetical protein PHU25_19255, partial [Deltaproteobacteria bacterium]|nr:hypothetical protein [Deltaproteobacteria bacterium]
METRTFRSRNMQEALRQTRRALGPEALIVSARTLDESSGFVEVTAVAPGAPRESAPPQPREADAIAADAAGDGEVWEQRLAPLREEIVSLRRMVRELARVADEAILPGFNDLRALILESSHDQESGRLLGPMYCRLVEKGVLPELARDLVRTVEIELG